MIDLTIDEDVVLDLWGRLDGVKILMAGNQWFVVPELLRLLEAEGVRAFVATLPPTAVLKMALGEEVKIGNLALAVKPDVISLPPSDMEALRGSLIESFQYAENEIVVAYRGRPVEGWCGLAEVKAAIPSPELEGIG
ncbi:MAG: ABC transporter substrate-binding protein, partial [Thermoproteus sp.]|nr:ABC transporter substrate-binding protein [Thermoproteus sp.]